MAELTDKQAAFVAEYLKCWNAAEAARRAGCPARSARQIGHEWLTKPDIRAEIDRRLAELTLSSDEVLVRLAEQARGSLGDFLVIDKAGRARLDLAKARKAKKLHLVKKFRAKTDTEGNVNVEIELHDPQNALQLIGKHHRLFGEASLNIDLSKLSEDQLERIANGEDPVVVVATPGAGGAGEETPAGPTEDGPAVS